MFPAPITADRSASSQFTRRACNLFPHAVSYSDMKRFIISFGAFCLIGLCVTGIVLIARWQRQGVLMRQFAAAGPANLAREEVLARQAGMALTPEQMQRPLPPIEQNAAPLYTTLTGLLHDKPLGLPKYAEGMDAFHSYTPEQIALVRRTLIARPDVMALVHQAADKPQCVFVRGWNNPFTATFPEYLPMREAARLLKTESYLLARDGKYHEAILNQQRGFRVAEQSASDPVLISFLVGTACYSLTLSGMQSILALAGPNAAVDSEVQRTVLENHMHLSLRRAMAGETGFGFVCLSRMHTAENQGAAAALAAGGFDDGESQKAMLSAAEKQNLHALIDAWQADYLNHMRPLVLAGDQPPQARRAAFAAVSSRLDQEQKQASDPTHLLSLILLPVFGRVDENETRSQAQTAVTLAAASLFKLKAQTGVFPASLPAQFVDPFTNKPLGYRLEGTNGFVVYSAGPTGTFDGGKPGDKWDNQKIVFRYPLVPVPPL